MGSNEGLGVVKHWYCPSKCPEFVLTQDLTGQYLTHLCECTTMVHLLVEDESRHPSNPGLSDTAHLPIKNKHSNHFFPFTQLRTDSFITNPTQHHHLPTNNIIQLPLSWMKNILCNYSESESFTTIPVHEMNMGEKPKREGVLWNNTTFVQHTLLIPGLLSVA